MLAANYKLIIEKGATYSLLITWKDSDSNLVDLTGYTAKLQIRTKIGGTLIIELTTENSRISLGGAAGTITLSIDSTDTNVLPDGLFQYDLELTGGSTVTRLIEGTVCIKQRINQDS